MFPDPKVDLSIEFCGVKFESPFILAAAPPTDDIEMVRDAFRAGWSGAVLKTTSVEGVPVPLVYPMMSGIDVESHRLIGMGNIDLISEHHIDIVEKRITLLKSEFPDRRVIASVSGADKESWQEVARRSCEAGADMIECSFSCPQGTMGLKPGAMLAQDPVASARVVDWIKEASGVIPVIIKLTPQVDDVVEIARAVRSAGADAVCVGNTIPALMGIDIDRDPRPETRNPRPETRDNVAFPYLGSRVSGPETVWTPIPNICGFSTYSGLSGPAIKPISLRCISLISKETGIPIAGSGGAITWRDALEFILLGASVVEFCTAVMHYGLDIVTDLKEGLGFYLDRLGIASVREIRGAALPSIVAHDELPRGAKWRPAIDKELCTKCDLCMIACKDGGHRAISVDADRYPVVDDEKCVGCALCSVMCPVYCVRMEEKRT